MPKEKVTLTLDGQRLQELRSLVGGRSLSAAVDRALADHLVRLRHLRAVDEWLAELDQEHGPVDPETFAWAGEVVEEWEARRNVPGRRAI